MKSELERDPQVARVQRVPKRQLITPSFVAPSALGKAKAKATTPWQFPKIGWKGRVETQIRVAVLDTGLDTQHPAFAGLGVNLTHSYGTFGGTSNADHAGHGTHVSGTICAKPNAKNGHSGLINCQLEVMKIFDDTPDLVDFGGGQLAFAWTVNPAFFARALARCIEEGFQVVNLSIGGGIANDDERDAFAELEAAGIAVIAAMGNEASSQPSYPAAYSDVIAVGASDNADSPANFSNFGPHIQLLAPGVDILSCLPRYPGISQWQAIYGQNKWSLGTPTPRGVNYATWNGTSMATPHVSAAMALLMHKYPTETLSQVKARLRNALVPVAHMQGQVFQRMCGYGRLNWAAL
jgi:subtilisin family serine protease